MTYRINEIFYSLQGEGFWTGTPAVFVRFSGCNLRCPFCDTAHQTFTPMSADDIIAACEEARRVVPSADVSTPGHGQGEGPVECKLSRSDDAAGNGRGRSGAQRRGVPLMTLPSDASEQAPIIILTGGEPGLQVDEMLIDKLHGAGYRVHIETNGTVALPEGIDWMTLSPKEDVPGLKGDGKVVLARADEIKVVFAEGDDPAHWAAFPAAWHFLQPCDVPGDPEQSRSNAEATVTYIKTHPVWRLSLQTHKFLGIR